MLPHSSQRRPSPVRACNSPRRAVFLLRTAKVSVGMSGLTVDEVIRRVRENTSVVADLLKLLPEDVYYYLNGPEFEAACQVRTPARQPPPVTIGGFADALAFGLPMPLSSPFFDSCPSAFPFLY